MHLLMLLKHNFCNLHAEIDYEMYWFNSVCLLRLLYGVIYGPRNDVSVFKNDVLKSLMEQFVRLSLCEAWAMQCIFTVVFMCVCVCVCITCAQGTHLSHADTIHSPASSPSTSVHCMTSLCDVTTTSTSDTRVTSSERLRRRRPDKTSAAIDSDASDCREDVAHDFRLLDVVDARSTTTLPDLQAATHDDDAQPDARIRRRQVRCRAHAGDKTRSKTSSSMTGGGSSSSVTTTVGVPTQLTCISRSKRRARVHAVC